MSRDNEVRPLHQPSPKIVCGYAVWLALALAILTTSDAELAAAQVTEDYGARNWRQLADGGLEYQFSFILYGYKDKDESTQVVVQCSPTKHFKVSLPAPVDVPAGREIRLTVKATLDADAASSLPPFTLEQCALTFYRKQKRLRALKRGAFALRLATPSKLTAPGKAYVRAIQDKVSQEEWAKRRFKGLRKQVDEKLESLGSPINPPTEGRWIKNGYHVWHNPKKVKLIEGKDGVMICPECKKRWTPEEIEMGSRRVSLFRTTFADLGMVAMVSGETRYSQAAREMLAGMADVYLTLPPSRYGSRLTGLVAEESLILKEALLCIRRLRAAGMLSDEDLKSVAAGWIIPSLEMVMERGSGTPNLAMGSACAVAMAGLALDWPPYVAWSLRDRRGIMQIIEKRIGEDGGWLENSLSYHMTTEIFFTQLPVELKLYGFDLLEREPELGKRLRAFYRFPALSMRPDQKLPAIADGGLGNPFAATNILAYWLTRDANLIPFVRGKDLEFSLSEMPVAPVVDAQSRHFRDFGITVLHDGAEPGKENWALIRHGKHHGGHCHYDILGMVSFAHGQPLHDDCGSNYKNPLHYSWARNTISHNTITVDETCQQKTAGKVEYLSTPKQGPQVIMVSDEGAYPGVYLERTVVMVHGIQLLIDRALSDDEHTYDWVFTCYGTVRGTSAKGKKIPPLPAQALPQDVLHRNDVRPTPKRVGYDVPRHLQAMDVSGDWWIDWEGISPAYKNKTATDPLAMKWLCHSPTPMRVVWGDSPGLKLALDQQRWVMARQVGRQALWITALVPQANPALVDTMKVVPAAEGEGVGVNLKSGTSESWVAVNWNKTAALKVGPIRTSNRVCVQTSDSTR